MYQLLTKVIIVRTDRVTANFEMCDCHLTAMCGCHLTFGSYMSDQLV